MKKTIQLSLISVALLSSLYAENVANLDTITVSSATKSAQSIKDITSNLDVITSEEIEEKHYTTVVEALNSVAGINFSNNGGLGTQTSVYLRGFDSKRILVLIDGIRYNDVTGLSGAPFEHLMIADIQQIEIIKGAQSGIWGADASAGVINIITKSAQKGAHASANVEYGSFNTKKYGLSASYKADNYYTKISSQKITTDSFSSKVPNDMDVEDFERDGYTNITTNIKAGFNITDTNKVDILHTIIHAESAYDTDVYDSSWAIDPIASANTKETTQTNDTFSKINFNHVDNFNTLDIYASRSLFDRNYPQSPYTQEFDGEIFEYGIKSNIPYREKDFLVISLDYKTFEHKNDLEEKYANKGVSLTNSNFFENILDGDLVFTESLRKDFYDVFDNKVTGKFGIKYFSNSIESLVFSTNIGTSYNAPTLYQLYQPGDTYYGTYYPTGNTNLVPEETTSYDFSIEYKKIQLTYFKNFIKNMIDYTNGYNNLDGISVIQGVEIAYKNNITANLALNASHTYLDAKDKDGKVLVRRPKTTTNLGMDYYPVDKLQLGLYGQYIGDRIEYDYGTYNISAHTGNYALANFVTNYEINKNFTTYAKVDNILDREYQVVDGYATAGRSFYLGLVAKY